MNKQIIFVLILLFMAVISISTVSAIWPFDSGSDVTVNGVKFHLPDGFDDVKQDSVNTKNKYEAFTYSNKKNHEFIKIMVMDSDKDKSAIYKSIKNGGTAKQETINGKDGYGELASGARYNYYYVDNGKYIMINIPFVYADEGLQHKELLAEIIK